MILVSANTRISHVLDLRYLVMLCAGLERTTDSKGMLIVVEWKRAPDARESRIIGLIRERNWYGTDGMEHVRTIKEPKQAVPTFTETVDLLMKVSCSKLMTATYQRDHE
jgi:phosphatidylglycerol phospholipase C